MAGHRAAGKNDKSVFPAISAEDYRKDPCGTLSIPLWKWGRLELPEGMEIRHHNGWNRDAIAACKGQVYFRLFHDFGGVTERLPEGITLITMTEDEFSAAEEMINRAYEDIRVKDGYLTALTATPVYAPELWLMAVDTATGERLGCAIGDYDPGCGEVILEWIQVLPHCRRRGIGSALVNGLLLRRPEGAVFATVSGKAIDPSCPELLYRSCGFAGQDYWEILFPPPASEGGPLQQKDRS